jgi:hypothetical protein
MYPEQRQFPLPSNEAMAETHADNTRYDNAMGKLIETKGLSDSEYDRKYAENRREMKTREAVRDDTLEDMVESGKRGYFTEISGDALARMKNDRGPKLHDK